MFFQGLLSCFFLHKIAVFLPDVLLSTHLASDFLGFASYIPCIGIFVFHWENVRFARYLRSRSEDNE